MNETHEVMTACDDGATPLGFFESGWQCFLEQTPCRPMSGVELAERAFYAGAALFFAGMRGCDEALDADRRDTVIEAMLDEVNDFCVEHNVRMEWEQKERL